MKKIAFLAIFSTFLFTTCKKDPPTVQPSGPAYTHQDLTAYSFFKTGTYWIYKDSASLIEDSVYVYWDTAYSYYQNNGIQKEGNYMYYDCRTHSAYYSSNYYYRISLGNYDINNGGVGVERNQTGSTGLNGNSYLMGDRFLDGAFLTLYTGEGTTYYKSFYDSLSISGIVYHNTVKFYDTKNTTENRSRTNFYMSKNIGITRKEILDSNKVWNLVRYHIIQ